MITRSRSRAARQLVCTGFVAATLSACAAGMQTRVQDIPALEQRATASASVDNLTSLGIAYYDAKRYEDARTTMERAIQAGAKDGRPSLYLGLANEELGDFTAARIAYERYMTTGGSATIKKRIQPRLALVARQELRQQAKVTLQREQELAAQPPTQNSIAIMPFRLIGVSEEMQPLQTALAEMIVTDIGFTQLQSIERVRVQSMLDEMALTLGGVANEETGARVGRMLRAQNVVQGQLNGTGNQIAVDATVLNTQTRTAGSPVTRSGELETIFELEKQLVFAILTDINYPLTPTERERINGNRATNLLAFLAYGRGLEALDRGDYDGANAQFRQASQLDPSFNAARTSATEATQLSSAATTSTTEIASMTTAAFEPPSVGLTASVANDLNPSPATAVTAAPTMSSTASSPTANERVSPESETNTAPPVTQAAKARVIITVRNPTGGN